MYRDKVTEIIDRLQLKYEEEMEEIREKLAVLLDFLRRNYE